jgi:rhomboid protease GluP
MLNNDYGTGEKLIARLSDTATLNEYSLVLSARNITHRIEYIAPDDIAVYVRQTHQQKALYELSTYRSENAGWPPQRQTVNFEPSFKVMSLIVIGCLSLVYYLSGPWSENSPWFKNGAGDSSRIIDNLEFYRLITSLSLHADIVHLLSNCVFGGVVLHYFLLTTGNGTGLIMVSLTASLATLVNVLVHGPNHHFVGFSTAVFSIIGMLCTINFANKTEKLGYNFIMPLMAGFALLAFLGSSGERTDLGAHLFGLLCGLLGGNVVRFSQFYTIRNSLILQIILGAASFLLFFSCWMWATVS